MEVGNDQYSLYTATVRPGIISNTTQRVERATPLTMHSSGHEHSFVILATDNDAHDRRTTLSRHPSACALSMSVLALLSILQPVLNT